MKQPHSREAPPNPSRHAWQYGLRDLLVVTLALSVLLATGRAFGGVLGTIELGLVILAGASVLIAGVFTRIWWFGLVGLVVCFLLVGLVVYLLAASFLTLPGARPIRYVFLAAGAVSCVCAAAGMPVILVSRPGEKRWPWTFGAVACFLTPAVVTPPDPFSMLMAAAPVWLGYTLVTLAWRKRKSALLVVGPLFLLGSTAIVVGADFAAFQATTLNLLRSLYPVALLGAAVTIVALVNRSHPSTEPNGY